MTVPEQRRLAAIMFTDIVGYTSLTERDESCAIRVRDRHRALARTLVEQFEGELLEAPGDEVLATFQSALQAVDCALALQAALRDDADLKIRIGIHLGDVLHRGGELIGEGVNVAARLRPLAEPGGICVSDAIWQQVRNRHHVRGRPLGARALKNVSEAVEVYAIETLPAAEEGNGRSRRLLRIAAGIVLTAALAYAAWIPTRAAVLSSVALYGPVLLGSPIDQEIGFATTTDGVRIAYATTGTGPPAVVWVLGWGTHIEGGLGSALYDAQGLLAMSSRRNLFVRYDGRGFGLSDRDVEDFSLDARVRDLEAVVDALGLERFALYVISAGGPTGIAYAARHPERVTRLALASTEASFGWLDQDEIARFRRMLALIETDWQTPTVTNLMVDLLAPNLDEVGNRVIGEFLRRSGSGHSMAGFFRAALEIDAEDEARRIRAPTLVIHGRDDPAVRLEAGRRLASLVPEARFEIVEGEHIEGVGGTPEVRARIMDFLLGEGAS